MTLENAGRDYRANMRKSAEELERHLDALRVEVRRAVTDGDRAGAGALRAELRRTEQAWDDALDALSPPAEPAPVPLVPPVPLRERVHQALTLLGAPAAPRLIVAVHQAFSAGELTPARLTSLRRDEERSFRSAPNARPYYLCAALTADLLAPARALLAVSTWPVAARIVGPLSPRVDFLTAAIRLADQLQRMPDPGPAATRLLRRFAANIPGAPDALVPEEVAAAARAERDLHAEADRAHREAAAARATDRLDDVQRLFGSRLETVAGTGT